MRKVLYIFGVLNDGDVAWLARNGTRAWIEPGRVLIHEGEPVDFLIIVLEGELRVEVAGIGEVARLGSGEIVGEMSFVDTAPPSATVTAAKRTFALFVDRAALGMQLAADPAFGMRFYRALAIFLADRLRGSVRRLGTAPAATSGEDELMEDQLDMTVLDTVALAGERFQRMLSELRDAR